MLHTDVFSMAVDRMIALYKEGHRIVVSFSGGKDSGCVLEICRIAARETGRGPVEVVLQDEEIAYPGTYEYCERVANLPDVSFNWLVMQQPMLNAFNREAPYFWCFDPLLKPEQWVRKPPARALYVPEKEISQMTVPWRFPPPEGKNLYAVMGLRISESHGRMYGLFSSGGYVTKPNKWGVAGVRPIYDWTDGDVWRALSMNKWDYNKAYDTFLALGVPARRLRIAPPTMHVNGIGALSTAAQAWPKWFDKVAERLPGVRTAAQFGLKSVLPARKLGETWEACFQRLCIDEAPVWIGARAKKLRERMVHTHTRHATYPMPEVKPCYTCTGRLGSWKKLTLAVFNGDPFSTKTSSLLPWVAPEFFRKGAGEWIAGPGL